MDTSPTTVPTTVPPKRRMGLSRINAGNSFITSKKIVINTLEKTPDTKTKDTNSLNCYDVTPTASISKGSKTAKNATNVAPVSSRPIKLAYKLSLCKTTTEVMTRKRMRSEQSKSQIETKRLKLESSLNTISSEESIQNESCDTKPMSDDCDTTNMAQSLREEIDEITKKIATTEKHQQKVSELESLISKWQEAGIGAIEQLESSLGTTAKDILAHYNIQPALFKLDYASE